MGMGGGRAIDSLASRGGMVPCDPATLNQTAEFGRGMKDAGRPGAGTARTSARSADAVNVPGRPISWDTRRCYVSSTGPPDGKAGQAGGGGDPLPGVLRQRVPAMGRDDT